MKKYIIKATYLEGIHVGKTYYLNKQGYVITNLDSVWQDSSYTLSSCKAVCTRKEKINTAEAIFEKRTRERRIAEGKTVSPYPLYVMQKYEPFEIETVDR
jgi:hypothetical protein